MRLRLVESRTFEGLTYEAGTYEVDRALAQRLLERFPCVCSVEELAPPSKSSRMGGKRHTVKSKMESEGAEPDTSSSPRHIEATYHARLLAERCGIDLTQIQGSGRGGKITVGDVREYLTTTGK